MLYQTCSFPLILANANSHIIYTISIDIHNVHVVIRLTDKNELPITLYDIPHITIHINDMIQQ